MGDEETDAKPQTEEPPATEDAPAAATAAAEQPKADSIKEEPPAPTEAPTGQPTEAPTGQPTEAPTVQPTEAPTEEPAEKTSQKSVPTQPEVKSTSSKTDEPKEERKISLEGKTASLEGVAEKVSVPDAKKEQKDAASKKSELSVHTKTSGSAGLGRRESELASSESLGRRTRGSAKDESIKETRKSRTERLSSKAKNVLGSTISIRRLSTTAEFYDRSKGARFMNTYKLDSDNPFNPDKVRQILENVMIEALDNLTYDAEKCPKQAKWASSAIRAKVKEMQFDRYKLICLVTIGEKNSQDVFVTCRFLWDVDRDRYATYCIENTYVFGIAQCFGIYYE